jgi:hypothetical protein
MQPKEMLMKTTTRLISAFALAACAFAGVTYAQEPVRSGANFNKPGRQVDDNILTSGQGFAKASREIDDVRPARPRRLTGHEFDDEGTLSPRKSVRADRSSDVRARKTIRRKLVDE